MRALGTSFSCIRHRTEKLKLRNVDLIWSLASLKMPTAQQLVAPQGGWGELRTKGTRKERWGSDSSTDPVVAEIIEDHEGFLSVVSFGSSPTPSPFSVSKLSLFLNLPVCRRSSLLTGGGGTISYDGEKAWSSINHSILSVPSYQSSMHPEFLCVVEKP